MLYYPSTQGVRPEYRGVEQLEARRAHNPEVVGSSPASATIKSPEIERFQDFFLLLGVKKFGENFCEFAENRLTHILTHNRIAPSGQVSIFQNTMSIKLEKPIKFQNFLKRKFYDLWVLLLYVQKLSQCRSPATGEVLLVYFVLLGVVWRRRARPYRNSEKNAFCLFC